MIPRGQFPYVNAIMSQRHVARVSDGFIMLTQEGVRTLRLAQRHQLLQKAGMPDDDAGAFPQ